VDKEGLGGLSEAEAMQGIHERMDAALVGLWRLGATLAWGKGGREGGEGGQLGGAGPPGKRPAQGRPLTSSGRSARRRDFGKKVSCACLIATPSQPGTHFSWLQCQGSGEGRSLAGPAVRCMVVPRSVVCTGCWVWCFCFQVPYQGRKRLAEQPPRGSAANSSARVSSLTKEARAVLARDSVGGSSTGRRLRLLLCCHAQ